MKKLLLLSFVSLFIISSCKKKDGAVSMTVTAAYPTITFQSTKFFSIKTGALRPAVSATAYDSFYKESCSVVIIDSTINNLVPGLYTGIASAKNHFGFVTNVSYLVAVTDVNDSMNLAGHWFEATYIPTTPDSAGTEVKKLARGLYSTSNVNAANTILDYADVATDYFAVLDTATIVFLNNSGTLSLTPGDTTMSYTGALGAVMFTKK